MIESIVTAVLAAVVPLVSDIVKAALAGTSSEELVSHARRAVRDYHAARPEGRAAMRAAWGDLGDALWGPRAYVGDSAPADTLPGAPAFECPDDLPPGEQGPGTVMP